MNELATNGQKVYEEWEAQLTHRPEDYFGPIYEWMDEGFSQGIFGTHRDADVLTESNYEAVKWALRGHINNEDLVRITTSNHWTVGWVESMHIKIRNRHGKFTRPFKIAVQLLEQLAEYPVLDEDDYSRREYEDLLEYLETEVDAEDAPKLAEWLFHEHSVSRADDIRYSWILDWKEDRERVT